MWYLFRTQTFLVQKSAQIITRNGWRSDLFTRSLPSRPQRSQSSPKLLIYRSTLDYRWHIFLMPRQWISIQALVDIFLFPSSLPSFSVGPLFGVIVLRAVRGGFLMGMNSTRTMELDQERSSLRIQIRLHPHLFFGHQGTRIPCFRALSCSTRAPTFINSQWLCVCTSWNNSSGLRTVRESCVP